MKNSLGSKAWLLREAAERKIGVRVWYHGDVRYAAYCWHGAIVWTCWPRSKRLEVVEGEQVEFALRRSVI